MAGVNPCVITNVLANHYADAVRTINRKFNALQRLAELLQQLGDLRSFVLPNLSALVPLYLINLDTYTNLVQACPFLNLPQTPSNASTAELQNKVNSAYAALIQQLKQNPFYRLGKLQAQLDKVQGPLNQTLNEGTQFMQCLQQACGSASDVVHFVNNISQTDFQGQLDQYTRTYLANNGKVLSTSMQNKVDQINGTINTINELMTTVPLITPSAATVVVPPVPPAPQIPAPPTALNP